ncbi:CocE/NonD family hydrolase [Saccharopolyspora pogona]|uniref:CocE/NonD family hydrolase n=1 Tax=Saccharopolyspora pogona TaxID=333966 RepID=UPI001CC233B7|nr:CocE/NonD family hydrolase [Saccharopolyspora pogona]
MGGDRAGRRPRRYDYYRSDDVSFGFDPVALAQSAEEGGRPDCGPVKQELTDGAPANGDVTPLWTEQDYVPNADRVTASVFAVHGLGDLNAKTIQFGQWWDALAARDVSRKLWLSQTGHVDPFDFRRAEWVDILHRWFDHWLLGVDNRITEEPAASIERAPDTWADEPGWSCEQAEPTALHPREDGSARSRHSAGPRPSPTILRSTSTTGRMLQTESCWGESRLGDTPATRTPRPPPLTWTSRSSPVAGPTWPTTSRWRRRSRSNRASRTR